jgi:hypothetical protein
VRSTPADRRQSQSGRRHLSDRAEWVLFGLTALLTAAYIAWLTLAQINFLYPLWHDVIGIDRTIEIFGPQNRYRQGFQQTSEAERSRLFAAIVDAIHNQGKGLRELVYHDTSGRALGRLLREPEILHLKDVARLIDQLKRFGLGASISTVALLIVIRQQRLPVPSLASLMLGAAVPLGSVTAVVLLLGPVEVFYWLHTLIFPPGHEWFFYYQDSLMSTMMKAPDLFGYIAAAWAMLSLLLLAGFLIAATPLTRSG